MGLEFKDNTSLSRVYNGETKAETCTFPYPGEFLRDGETLMNPVYSKTFKTQEEKNKKIINAKMEITRDARVIEILIPISSTFIPSARTPMGVKKKNVAGVACIETMQTLLYLVQRKT